MIDQYALHGRVPGLQAEVKDTLDRIMVIELQDDLGIRLVHDDLGHVKTVGDRRAVTEGKTGGPR